ALMTVDINLLHQRMRHICMDPIQYMMVNGQLLGIDAITGQPTFYEPFTLGKMKKLPFQLTTSVCTTHTIQIIHTNVGGPITPKSYEGFCY
ncbi:hypothetical protein BDR04DRAFT_979426, partial [Suillus decipiens]